MSLSLHSSSVAEIDPVVLYEILRLRVDVFVVEQDCPYPELDGRDLEPGARLLWFTDDDGRVLATLRVLSDGDDRRIGRVATAVAARGRGLAADLMRAAVAQSEDRLVRLDAQAHLSGWYARFGFVVDGDEFLEDGIPHLPMTLAARR
ncbi:GNAT family N-acetyltransferase [Frigoribacterium sp. VKM Ac-2836]|uniref:GNAT family N-acetyltransferase n=1 Tax=Frigoribacterium sp. VKM Ac-2836 TaxID=2739014 RepID=UPI001563CA54|nr:GNAT family N-acetyltransferase [Frigoribacterium sp. VKM Ac-2836]